MGICESANDDKNENNQSKNESKIIKNETSDISIIENDKNYNFKHDSKKTKNSEEPRTNSNICPRLDRYERSFGKKSETSQYNNTKSEFSSNLTEEEIIIKGEINKNCPNKEKDFDNNSFKKLIKNNGGIILKEDLDLQSNSQNNNDIIDNINYNGSYKENNSDISFKPNTKSVNSNASFINGKKNKIYSLSEISRDKITNNSLKDKRINSDNNSRNNNKSFYSNKTINPKLHLNKYLNGIFNTDTLRYNNKKNNQFLNRNTNRDNIPTTNNNNNLNNNICKYEKKNSLISNHNNMTNDSSSDNLMDSFIEIPQIDERIPESDLNFGGHCGDIISDLSS